MPTPALITFQLLPLLSFVAYIEHLWLGATWKEHALFRKMAPVGSGV